MFNTDAVERLKRIAKEYEEQAAETQKLAMDLFEVRKATSRDGVIAVEAYINTLAHTPKEFTKIVSEYRINVEKFDYVIDECLREAGRVPVKEGTVAGLGLGAGVAMAAFAPTAAMAIATTFGTASTGTAIAALSGAAATNAALAWLGGGALVAGGGGIAAGEALLVLAGPVGWAIGGVALIGTGLWWLNEKWRNENEATKLADDIEGKIEVLKIAKTKIAELMRATKTQAAGLAAQLAWLKANAPADFAAFGSDHKHHLGALINNVECLSVLLNKKVA